MITRVDPVPSLFIFYLLTGRKDTQLFVRYIDIYVYHRGNISPCTCQLVTNKHISRYTKLPILFTEIHDVELNY